DSCDLDSELLEQQIQETQQRIDHLVAIRKMMDSELVLGGLLGNQLFLNHAMIAGLTNFKQILQEKLEKLFAFEASSTQIFANLSELKATVVQGKAQTESAWNGTSFTIPTDLAWTTTIGKQWKARTEEHDKVFHETHIKELEKYNVY